ncbi:hypothetical protein DSM3645_01105 [Blastopirellula marina DSM 3645]|uniref:HTH cro/C1-type domain-containing protein n=1 Tax=Blastopirellula marina DSM 3645 TaxID=314230 RepID=A3ZMU3_9BACT|nr:hypothetical protein DSM3645_01105 [Blastopirellula marina DSM 3645]
MFSANKEITLRRSIHVDGARLKSIRLQLGLTQETVATATGYTDRLVRKLENGGPVNCQTLNDFITYYKMILSRVGTPALERDICFQTLSVQPDSDREAIVRKWFEQAYNQRSLDCVNEVFHPDVLLIAEGQMLQGSEEITKRVAAVLAGFDPLHLEVESVFSQENIVITYWRATKTHAGPFLGIQPTGRTVSIRGNSMAKFQGDKIIEVRDHWDVQDLLAKLT